MNDSMVYKDSGTVKLVERQSLGPYLDCAGVDDLLQAYPNEATNRMATYMFMLGYIEGKRAERARRKARISKISEAIKK